MTLPSFVASSAVDANAPGNGTSVVITAPAAWLSGHLAVTQIYKESSAAITKPTGWVEVAGSPFPQGSSFWQHIFYKVLGGGEPATYTFSWTGSTWREGGAIALVDVDPTTPINAIANATNASSTTVSCPAVTPTVNNTLIVTFAELFNDETWSAIGQGQTRRQPLGVRAFGIGTVAGPASGVSSGGFTHTVLAAAIGQGVTIAFQEVQSAATIPNGQQSTALPPAGRKPTDYSWLQSLVPNLVGQDAVIPGRQSTDLPPIAQPRARDYSFAPPANLLALTTVAVVSLPPGQQTTDLPPRAPLRGQSHTHSVALNLLGQDALPPGRQSVELPPRPASRLRDYSHVATLLPDLNGQDALTVGRQYTDLPPSPAPLRLRDYSHTVSTPLNLIGQDATLVGHQYTDLPPRAASRAVDYTFAPPINLQTLTTVVQPIPYGAQLTDLPLPPTPARARDYSLTVSFPLELIGQDAVAPGKQSTDLPPRGPLRARDYTFAPPANLNALLSPPVGTQSTDLPPRAPARARDYSITQSFPLELIGQDATLAGKQSTDLPPSAPARMRDYSFAPPINLQTLTTVVQPIPYGAQATALPLPPVPARARDYSIAESFTLELIGQDNLPPGRQSTDLSPRAPSRLPDYTFAPPINLPCFLLVVQPMPYGQQSYDLPPVYAAPRRATDYSLSVSYTLVLIGRDNVPPGKQALDLPPIAPARWSQLTNPSGVLHRGTTYLGRDTLYGANGEAPTYDYPNPRAPRRLLDYTVVQSFPLEVYQQLPIGQSTQATELPPRAPSRLRDYTHTQSTPLNLLGRDAMVPGRQWTELAPSPAPRRLVEAEYTIVNRLNLPDIVANVFPGVHTLSHRAMFSHTLTHRAMFVHTLTHSAVSLPEP